MVVVNGNLDDLQVSLDFYLNITSDDGTTDSRILRDRFFAIFEENDADREENYLVYQERVDNDYIINREVEPLLVGDECEFSLGVSYFDTPSTVVLEKEKTKLENEKKIGVEITDGLEDEKGNIDIKNTYLVDETLISDDFEEDDFVNWGSSEDEETTLEEEYTEEETSTWGWGDSDEDFVEQEFSEEAEDLDDSYQDVENDFSNWDLGDESSTDETSIEEGSSDFAKDLDAFDSSFMFDESEEPESKVVVVESKSTSVVYDEVKDVPKDLRDFVKLYPNCDMSFALKYFSKKEIDKQLNLGRVFKRKNKLMI